MHTRSHILSPPRPSPTQVPNFKHFLPWPLAVRVVVSALEIPIDHYFTCSSFLFLLYIGSFPSPAFKDLVAIGCGGLDLSAVQGRSVTAAQTPSSAKASSVVTKVGHSTSPQYSIFSPDILVDSRNSYIHSYVRQQEIRGTRWATTTAVLLAGLHLHHLFHQDHGENSMRPASHSNLNNYYGLSDSIAYRADRALVLQIPADIPPQHQDHSHNSHNITIDGHPQTPPMSHRRTHHSATSLGYPHHHKIRRP